jgi:hypothetical protein
VKEFARTTLQRIPAVTAALVGGVALTLSPIGQATQDIMKERGTEALGPFGESNQPKSISRVSLPPEPAKKAGPFFKSKRIEGPALAPPIAPADQGAPVTETPTPAATAPGASAGTVAESPGGSGPAKAPSSTTGPGDSKDSEPSKSPAGPPDLPEIDIPDTGVPTPSKDPATSAVRIMSWLMFQAHSAEEHQSLQTLAETLVELGAMSADGHVLDPDALQAALASISALPDAQTVPPESTPEPTTESDDPKNQ